MSGGRPGGGGGRQGIPLPLPPEACNKYLHFCWPPAGRVIQEARIGIMSTAQAEPSAGTVDATLLLHVTAACRLGAAGKVRLVARVWFCTDVPGTS